MLELLPMEILILEFPSSLSAYYPKSKVAISIENCDDKLYQRTTWWKLSYSGVVEAEF